MTTKKISTMSMALMTAAAVLSLRGLPMMAKEELTMFFYIGFATFIFLIPASLVAAELGSTFAGKGGGVYTWVGEAFTKRWGFLAIWLQWIQNVVWYPVVLSFGGVAVAYAIGRPDLAKNGTYIGIFIIVFYWLATFITLRGIDAIAKVTSYGFIIGTLIPGVIIIFFGALWYFQGHPVGFEQLAVTDTAVGSVSAGKMHPIFFPHLNNLPDISFLAGIILLFAGVEVHAVHVNEMENPRIQYPRAIFTAAIIIFLLFTFGSLAIATVIPYNDIAIEAGLLQTFAVILKTYNLNWLLPVISLFVAFGVLGGVMSWISGPSRGLLETANDGALPKILAKTNKKGIQENILFTQGCIVTVLACLYFVMDNVSVAFFLLSALTVTLYLIMYVLMYLSAIKLRITQPDLPRAYKVPGGNTGLFALSAVGLSGVLFGILIAFVPPSQLPIGSPNTYIGIVAAGTIVFAGLPFLIYRKEKTVTK